MHNVFVYGSLRLGEYNQKSFSKRFENGFNYKSTHKVKGYDLFSFGSYPGINKGEGELTVDLFEASEPCLNSLNRMELGAGYTIEEVEIDGIKGIIYLYGSPINRTNLVPSGDWSKRTDKW